MLSTCRYAILILTLFGLINSTVCASVEEDIQEIEKALYEQELSFPSRPEGVPPTQWTGLRTAVEQAKLFPRSEGIGREDGQFGYSVSLSGNRALIGGIGLGESAAGGAVIFINDGGTWIEETSLMPADGEERDRFGSSVSLDGDRALIGAPEDDDKASNSGAVYVFDFNGTEWVETQKLSSSDSGSFRFFGQSVSLYGDRALIGTRNRSAYVFDFDGVNWMETVKLQPLDVSAANGFGQSVSLSANRALIGAPFPNSNDSTAGAAYIFDFDGMTWSETVKLLPDDDAEFAEFGFSVGLHGDWALIGAPGDDDNGPRSGSAFVFDFNGIDWAESAKLLPMDGADFEEFGSLVSLSGDRVLIGARFDNDGVNFGSAYVFDFNGMSWTETDKIEPSGVDFGFSVSLSGDQALIGAPSEDDNVEDTGSAYVFEFNGTTWAETTELVAGDGAFRNWFGLSASVFGDRALVGVPNDDANGRFSGSAYVFDYNGMTWTATTRLLPSDGMPRSSFGQSVSLFGDRALIGGSQSAYVFDFDGVSWMETTRLLPSIFSEGFGDSVSLFGNRALIGAGSDDYGLRNSGSAFVFDFNGMVWSETDRLKPDDVIRDGRFGSSVSLFSDRALIGMPGDNDFGTRSGSAYVFDFIGGVWRETTKLLPADGAEFDSFGQSVSLSGDRALIGSPSDNDNGSDSGSAYIFGFNGQSWVETAKLLPADGSFRDFFGSELALFGKRALIGTSGDDDNGENSGSAYVFDLIGANWRETVKLLPADGEEDDRFGSSVSLFANRVLVGAYLDDDSGTDSGSAYAFDILSVFQDGFESQP